MKKTLTKSIIITWIALSCFSPSALAQTATATTKAASVLPANIDMFFESDTAVENPLWNLASAQMAGAPEVAALLFDMAGKNNVTFAIGNFAAGESNYDIYAALNTDESGFKKFVETSKAEISEVYGDKTIYKIETDAYATLLGDLMLVTNKIENLRIAIGNFNKPGNALEDNSTFNAVANRNLGGSFLNIYLNPAVILGQVTGMTDEISGTTDLGLNNTFTGLMKAMQGEGVSIAQVSDGIKFAVAVESSKEKLAALNLSYDKYNFTPSLYKLVSGKDLIFYEERTNLKEQIDDFMKMFTLDTTATAEMNTFKVDFKTNTGIDFDRELLPMLDKNYLVTAHNSSQLLPAMTMIFDVREHTASAGQSMLKISEYIKKELQKEEDSLGKDIFKYDIYDAGGTAFYDFTIYLTNLDDSGDLDFFSGAATTLNLRMAVTADGYAVISTLPDLNGWFRKSSTGVLDNTGLNAEFTNPSATLNEVVYLDIDNTAAYVNNLLTHSGYNNGSIDTAAALFKPWHNLFMRSYGDTDSLWVEGKLNFDMAAMGDYTTYIENLFSSAFSSNYDYTSNMPDLGQLGFNKSFCDVSSNDWYYSYVTDLSGQMIISGYPDGCFKPNQPITRAEFIKMAMKALGKAATINSSYQPFKDVPPLGDAWYSENINMAAMMGFADGYSDGTFHPNALITRAEAVQILYNMSTQLPAVNVIDQPLESLISFNDVHKTDWFFTPVVAAYYYNIVNGATPTSFEPNRNITRAEAAKIINLLQTLELQAAPPAEGEYVGP